MIEITLLSPEELKPAYTWFEGDEYEPWEEYKASRTGPQWMHLGLFQEGDLVGCVSIENQGDSCTYHVATKRRSVKSADLRKILIESTRLFLRAGMKYTAASMPSENRAARLLARSCGMTLRRQDEVTSHYSITADEFVSHWGEYGAQEITV